MFKPDKPLWLPEGSVRALIAFFVLTMYVLGHIETEVATLVLGFYFVGRATESK